MAGNVVQKSIDVGTLVPHRELLAWGDHVRMRTSEVGVRIQLRDHLASRREKYHFDGILPVSR